MKISRAGRVVGGEGEVGLVQMTHAPVGLTGQGRDVEFAVLAEGCVGHDHVHGELGVWRDLDLARRDDLGDRGEPLVGQERVGGHERHRTHTGATPRLGCMSRLTRADVEHVAQLARLALTDDEIEHFTAQLEVILEHAAQIAALDTHDVPPTAHPLPVVNVLRADEVRPSLPRDEVLAMAPASEDGRFRVPRILDAP
jgi:aspartyl-tRNA(Asn)/glutamyl-tRNA(Gln) amidotransferase subunit C